jgi:hypothetical protein
MKRVLHICEGKGINLPIEAVTQTFAILAKRRVGKTYTASVMAEEMLKLFLQIIIIDPTDAWWGLRSSKDGKGPGYPILVLGGEHGDLPLSPESGELVAKLVVEKKLSVILSLFHMRKNEQIRFCTAFFETLYRLNRDPVHVFIDEADAVAPQNPMKGAERCLGAVDDIVRRGGLHGIGTTLITQRAAVLNKDVLTQTEVLITLQTTSPQDIDAQDRWVKMNGTKEQRDQFLESVASLPKGTAWIWSPSWLDVFMKVKIRERETFNSSKTPEVGEKRVVPKKMARVDLEKIKEQIEATVEKSKIDDPRLLRQKITELQTQVKKMEKQMPAAFTKLPKAAPVEKLGKTKIVEVPILPKRQMNRLTKLLKSMDSGLKSLKGFLEAMSLQGSLEPMKSSTPAVMSTKFVYKAEPPKSVGKMPPRTEVPVTPKPVVAKVDLGNGEHKIVSGQRKMLEVLAAKNPISRTDLAILSGIAYTSGTYSTYLSELKNLGYAAEAPGGFLVPGSAKLPQELAAAVISTQDLADMWKKRDMCRGERGMFDVLLQNYPTPISRQELAEKSDLMMSGTFSTYLSKLKRYGLVVDAEGGGLKAHDALFAYS